MSRPPYRSFADAAEKPVWTPVVNPRPDRFGIRTSTRTRRAGVTHEMKDTTRSTSAKAASHRTFVSAHTVTCPSLRPARARFP